MKTSSDLHDKSCDYYEFLESVLDDLTASHKMNIAIRRDTGKIIGYEEEDEVLVGHDTGTRSSSSPGDMRGTSWTGSFIEMHQRFIDREASYHYERYRNRKAVSDSNVTTNIISYDRIREGERVLLDEDCADKIANISRSYAL